MRRYAGLMFLLSALWANGVGAQTVAQPVELISVPVDYHGRQIQLTGELQKPIGPGPFPVVIALHSCGGYWYPSSIPIWLSLFWQQGYATLHLDSFSARGYAGICAKTDEVTTGERASDALAAAYVLAGRPDIQREHIAVIGWSHGGGSAAAVATDRPGRRSAHEKLASGGGKLVASVDLYGGCDLASYRVLVPLLVLVGSSDDWVNGGASCLALAKANPAFMTVQVYPGAHHGFDDPNTHLYLSHMMSYNAAATADAQVRVVQFLRRFMQ